MRVTILTIGATVRIMSDGRLQNVCGTVKKIFTYVDAKGARKVAQVRLGASRRQTFKVDEIEVI